MRILEVKVKPNAKQQKIEKTVDGVWLVYLLSPPIDGKLMQLTALILAGGQSSRMGRDKALLPIKGLPFLQRVCETALQCTDQVYVITAWPDRYRTLVPPNCQFIQEKAIASDTGSKSPGPLVGFAQGLACIKTDWVLLLACDLPCLQAAVLQRWKQQLDQAPAAAIALLPKHAKGWEPLCGFYRHRCLQSLTPFIQSGGRSFQSWLSQQTVIEIPNVDPKMLFNCNTPDDLKQLGA